MRKKLTRLFSKVGLWLTVLTVASFLGQFHWTLDVLSHFNLQYGIGLIICFVGLIFMPDRRHYAFGLLPALLINGVILAPYFLPLAPPATAATTSLRVATLNVSAKNKDYEATIAYLQEYQPDIVMLTEAEPELMTALNRSVSELYPYILDESVSGTFGLALLSQYPFVTARTVPLLETSTSGWQRQLLRAEIEWQGSTVTVYGAHPLPPLSGRWAEWRNTELQIIQTMLADDLGPLILLGDFNASPWAYPMRRLTEGTSLYHAAHGFGIGPTWYYLLFGAPLDHILVSSTWRALLYDVNDDVGSDHYPVMADLTLKN